MSVSSSGKVKWSDISTLFTNLNTARAKFFPSQSNFSPSSGGTDGVVLAKLIQDLNKYIESFSSNAYVRTRANISQNPPNAGDLISPTIINTFETTIRSINDTCAYDSSNDSSYRGSYDSSDNSSYRGSYDSSDRSSYRGSYNSSYRSSYDTSANGSHWSGVNTSWCSSWRSSG